MLRIVTNLVVVLCYLLPGRLINMLLNQIISNDLLPRRTRGAVGFEVFEH